jgi:DNA-binding SARP family transcriptional activator/tetratricopeptide (TPR) repeat protein
VVVDACGLPATPRPTDRTAPLVKVQILGRFGIWVAGREQPDRVFGGRLARQLLRMLAVRRGTLLSKDVAVESLWPTHPPADASGNVEILISRIRRVLRDRSVIQTGSGGYTLAGDDRCWVDVEAFLSAVERGQAELNYDLAASLSAFKAALGLWHGEPLVEDAYADWAAEHRRHLLRAHLDALEGAATAALALDEATSAVAWAQAAAERHPLREASVLLLVRALAASRDRAAALVTFDGFRRRLGDELGIDPSAEALETRLRVLRDEIPTVPAPRSAPPDEYLPGGAPGSAPPFVDRDEVCTRITGLLADRQVRVVIVRGGPGSGKSRMLAELVERVGMPTVPVRAQRAHRDNPGALAATILHALGVGEDTADACDLGAISGWSGSAACGDAAVRAVHAAVRAAQAVAQPRLMIAIDDLQWADDGTLALLRALRQRVPGLRVLATCPTTRQPGAPDPVRALAGPDPALVRQVKLDPPSTAQPAQAVVEPALRALCVTGRELLTLLAVLGRDAPTGVLATAAGADLRTTLDKLDELRAAGLARAHGEGWAVSRNAVCAAALADVDPAGRMRRHLMLAQALREQGADLAEVARHLAEAGDRTQAATAFAEAARVRLNQVDDQDALRLAQAGLATAPPGRVRAALLNLRGEARRRRGQLRGARADLDQALVEAPPGPERSRLLARQAILEMRSRSAIRGYELAELAVAEAGDDPAAGGQALAARALVDLWLARPASATRQARRARRLLHRAGDAEGTARLLHWHAMAAFLAGRLPTAAAEFEQLAELPSRLPETPRLWNPRATLGHALVFLDEPEAGLAEIDTALSWACTVDDPIMRSSCLWHRSEALIALERHAEAAQSARAALAIARRIEHAEWTSASLRALGIARHAAGDLDGAEAALRDALRTGGMIPLFAGWASARLGLVLVGQGRLADAWPLIHTALHHAVPLARHEARWAHAEFLHARHDPTAPQIAASALAAARTDGYRALLPRLGGLAGR